MSVADWIAITVICTPVVVALAVSELLVRRRRAHEEDIEPVSDECLARLRGDQRHWSEQS